MACLSALFQVFEEIEKLEKEGKRVTRFSVTGYSLGGLLGRYLVGYVSSLLLLSLFDFALLPNQHTPSAQVLRHRNSGQLQYRSNPSRRTPPLSLTAYQTRGSRWASTSW